MTLHEETLGIIRYSTYKVMQDVYHQQHKRALPAWNLRMKLIGPLRKRREDDSHGKLSVDSGSGVAPRTFWLCGLVFSFSCFLNLFGSILGLPIYGNPHIDIHIFTYTEREREIYIYICMYIYIYTFTHTG